MKVNIAGLLIDKVIETNALDIVFEWAKSKSKHYVVTPNMEMIMLARKDQQFKKVINEADLAIPDSSRFGWVFAQQTETNPIVRILSWPTFFFRYRSFPVTTGTDLMMHIIKKSPEQLVSIGLLGGGSGVAERLAERLKKRYPKLEITFAGAGGQVNKAGDSVEDRKYEVESIKEERNTPHSTSYLIPATDILFVAFGQGKQEKWIKKNLEKYPVKVMIGVGGAFDYLVGDVSRAPKWMRNLGLEWLYRGVVQPWRLKRFLELIKFTLLILVNPKLR